MKYLSIGIILFSAYLLGGCLAKSSDVQALSDQASIDADNLLKLTKLVDDFHKTDKTKILRDQFKKDANEIFEFKLKDKKFVSAEQIKQGTKTISSISGAVGIPLGGPIMDTIGTVLSLILGAKGVAMANQKRKKREYALAEAEPTEAHKIRKG